MLPLSAVSQVEEVRKLGDEGKRDVVLIFAAGGWTDLLEAASSIAENVIVFVRYRSGPVYLWYEIVHPRFLRQHTDQIDRGKIDHRDVVVDDGQEVLWRLRALSGLKNTVGSRIVALGGAGGWHAPAAPELARQRWKLDIKEVSYDQLERILQEARSDGRAMERARDRASEYLSGAGVSLETDRKFVDSCFLLEDVFRSLMARFDARAFTIGECMSTIMPVSETTACLPLSTLNDSGYIAFCESDFVVVPSGILLSSISGKPPFLHNPTFPHQGMITLAHCTAPRRMDGVSLESARIVTHYESDYGAAPKVEMRPDQIVTIINPDFRSERWLGLKGKILDAPFRPICRSQIDVELEADSAEVAEEMRGFHWMLVYGDYLDEVGYALKKTRVEWKRLT
jgi:L-fucose isomerase-like protein